MAITVQLEACRCLGVPRSGAFCGRKGSRLAVSARSPVCSRVAVLPNTIERAFVPPYHASMPVGHMLCGERKRRRVSSFIIILTVGVEMRMIMALYSSLLFPREHETKYFVRFSFVSHFPLCHSTIVVASVPLRHPLHSYFVVTVANSTPTFITISSAAATPNGSPGCPSP